MDTKRLIALVVGALAAATLPMWAGDQYQLHLATLICAYWVLIGGLNLVIGYSGQLSIGHVGLLSIGSTLAEPSDLHTHKHTQSGEKSPRVVV